MIAFLSLAMTGNCKKEAKGKEHYIAAELFKKAIEINPKYAKTTELTSNETKFHENLQKEGPVTVCKESGENFTFL